MRRDPLKPLKFAQSSRKHKIGRERITYVINTYEGSYLAKRFFEQKVIWVGRDFKGLELEVIDMRGLNEYLTNMLPVCYDRHFIPWHR